MELGDALKLKLDAITNAQSLSRYVVVTGMVLGFAFTLSAWNAYLSWDRILVTHWERATENKTATEKNALSTMLREEHSKQWLESRNITLQPIGVRIGIHDIVPICTIVMLTVSIWMYYSLAREFAIIRSILAFNYEKQEAFIVLSAITDQSLFYRVTRQAPSHRQTDSKAQKLWARRLESLLTRLGLSSRTSQRVARRIFLPTAGCEFLRRPNQWTIPWLVTFTPLGTIFLVFVGDVASIFQKDLFDKNQSSMAKLIAGDLRLAVWLIAFYSLSIVLAYTCWRLCQASCRYFLLCEKCLKRLKQRHA